MVYSKSVPRSWRGMMLCYEVLTFMFCIAVETNLSYPDPDCGLKQRRDECEEDTKQLKVNLFFLFKAIWDSDAQDKVLEPVCEWKFCSKSCTLIGPSSDDSANPHHYMMLALAFILALPLLSLFEYLFETYLTAPLPLEVATFLQRTCGLAAGSDDHDDDDASRAAAGGGGPAAAETDFDSKIGRDFSRVSKPSALPFFDLEPDYEPPFSIPFFDLPETEPEALTLAVVPSSDLEATHYAGEPEDSDVYEEEDSEIAVEFDANELRLRDVTIKLTDPGDAALQDAVIVHSPLSSGRERDGDEQHLSPNLFDGDDSDVIFYLSHALRHGSRASTRTVTSSA